MAYTSLRFGGGCSFAFCSIYTRLRQDCTVCVAGNNQYRTYRWFQCPVPCEIRNGNNRICAFGYNSRRCSLGYTVFRRGTFQTYFSGKDKRCSYFSDAQILPAAYSDRYILVGNKCFRQIYCSGNMRRQYQRTLFGCI